ncbi:ABC-F family ATP-binding cassette domain-containing protein [Chitinimonas naiadis]
MTTLISAVSLQLEANHGLLFQDLSFTLKHGDRVGLIGHNGSGKSTLLKLLSRQLEPGAGTVHYARACRLQLVEQHLPERLMSLSLREALLDAIAQQPEHAWRVDSLLAELGLDPASFDVPVASLSGGQHTRLLLGRAVLQDPNVLLLDEPSNHLDLPAMLWLEDFLQRWQGAYILVSHDQRLLDNATRHSWLLRDQRLYAFDLPCSAAMQALAEADVAASERHAAEQKEIDRLAASSHRLAVWGKVYDNEGLARKAKTLQKRVDRLKDEQSFVSDGAPWRLTLQGQSSPARQLLVLEDLPVRAAPGLPSLFNVEALWVRPGDKIALLGANGMGKSSLLRLCWRAIQSGQAEAGFSHHAGAAIGYYDQSLQQLRDDDDLSSALGHFVRLDDMAGRRALIAAGFPYARHGQKVGSLSGGERARLLFLGLSLARYHLLLLDEPTNHLDMQGKHQLADALRTFAGSFVLVSHDRQLIEHACQQFWVVQDGRLTQWQDAAGAYQHLLAQAPRETDMPATLAEMAAPIGGHVLPDDPDGLLQRLCELETLLAADLARKARNQKPSLQLQWQQEIEQLSLQLGLID